MSCIKCLDDDNKGVQLEAKHIIDYLPSIILLLRPKCDNIDCKSKADHVIKYRVYKIPEMGVNKVYTVCIECVFANDREFRTRDKVITIKDKPFVVAD